MLTGKGGTDMTLGERIQALRKEAGLSQEELGEKLGVARQSVSKWESDATIPELEKLIAMSRLFGLSVGAILGLEEDEGPDHELTDRELRALEAIAQKLSPSPAEPKRRRRWPYVLLAAAVVIAGVSLVGRMQRLENQLSSLYSSIDGVDRNVRGQINSLTGQVRDILEAQNSVTAGQSYTIAEIDPEAGTITFDLSATPRQYREGMTAQFTAAGPEFETVSAEGTEREGQTFTAALTCPLADDITLSVAFQSGETIQNQRLGRKEGLLSMGWPEVYGTAWLFGDVISQGQWDKEDDIDVNWMAGFLESEAGTVLVTLKTLELRLWQDGELVWTGPVEVTGEEDGHAQVPMEAHLSGLEEGSALGVSARYTDSYGRSNETWFEYCEVVKKPETGALALEPADVPDEEPWEN